jgi:uncharacterized membrane protein
MNYEEQRTGRLIGLFPFFLLLLAALGIGLILLLQQPELAVTSLVLILPLVLAAVILLVNRQINIGELVPAIYNKIHFSHLFLINLVIFTASLIVLISDVTRPLSYFILISVYTGLILLQILSRREGWSDWLIIFEIILLSLNLMWGVTLKYPLYFGDTDTLVHLNLTNTILQTGHVETYDVYYQHYPLYHIFTAIGSLITGLSLKTSLFVFMGLSWQAGIVFSYLIFKKLSDSRKLAAVACLLLASSSQLIFYSSYAIARSLAFVFLLFWIYLIFDKAQRDFRYLLLSFIAMAAMIMTHHINVLFVVPLLVLIYLCQRLVGRFRQNGLINPVFIYLLSICSISYLLWVASEMANATLPTTLRDLIRGDLLIGGDFTHGYGVSIILGAIYYSFVLLLGLLGLSSVFSYPRLNDKKRIAGIFALVGFFMLIIYVPSPVNLMRFSNTVLLDRFALIASPFVAFLMAYGLKFLYNMKLSWVPGFARSVSLIALPVGLVIIMTFFSQISTGNTKDDNNLPHTAMIDSPYFTDSELVSFTFLSEKGNGTIPIYADYETIRNDFSLGMFSNKNIIESGDINYIQNGYLTLRVSEMQRKKALTFSTDGSTNSSKTYRYRIDSINPEFDIFNNLKPQNEIYSDRDVKIYFIRNPGSLTTTP